ncbi:hypothetical protein NDU88_010006 [Pleurodeles waltl]|uniref:Uncharacterized protein n=1 Tax=Pleurodeles waltl TaxID=8319 RepID=A0AAV7QT76_PLEWA|nr:hypothetical protein NDU88_010006 [Pleurodeles waltl]
MGIMCPRCGCPNADLCQMFFQCLKLESLITGISDILKKILKQTIYLIPQMVLLGVDHAVCNSRERYFLFIAMSVFRSCIASLWRDVDPPRFSQWFSRLLSMYHLENSLYELKGAAAVEMELFNSNNPSRTEMQRLCKKRGLNAGTQATKMDLQIASRAYGEVKRVKSTPKKQEDGNPEEDGLDLNEKGLAIDPELHFPTE